MTNQSFTFNESSISSSTASNSLNRPDNSLNTSPNIQTRSHDNLLTTAMASLNIQAASHDTTDGPVELPEHINIVYIDSDDKKLCLATISHAGDEITGCGHGNSEESAKQDAIDKLTSNFRILCAPIKI